MIFFFFFTQCSSVRLVYYTERRYEIGCLSVIYARVIYISVVGIYFNWLHNNIIYINYAYPVTYGIAIAQLKIPT